MTATLTQTEQQVLDALPGRTINEVVAQVHKSVSTVRNTITSLRHKGYDVHLREVYCVGSDAPDLTSDR